MVIIVITTIIISDVVVVGLMKQVHMITTVLLPKKSCYLKLGISKNTAIYLSNQ